MMTMELTNPIEDHDKLINSPLSLCEAFRSIEELINYFENLEIATSTNLMLLSLWQDITSAKRIQ